MALRKAPVVIETVSNTSVTMIMITEDKLVNILTDHITRIKKANNWVASLSFFLSLLLTYVSTNFHNALGLSADTIKGIFLAILLFSFIYLLYTIYNAWKIKDSVGDIVKDIKGTQQDN